MDIYYGYTQLCLRACACSAASQVMPWAQLWVMHQPEMFSLPSMLIACGVLLCAMLLTRPPMVRKHSTCISFNKTCHYPLACDVSMHHSDKYFNNPQDTSKQAWLMLLTSLVTFWNVRQFISSSSVKFRLHLFPIWSCAAGFAGTRRIWGCCCWTRADSPPPPPQIRFCHGPSSVPVPAEKGLSRTNNWSARWKGQAAGGHAVNPGSSHNPDVSINSSPFTGIINVTTGCPFNVAELNWAAQSWHGLCRTG